ncbi:MAG: class I SAM-dependent methyltransferase [Solirubrobacterales bacterium]
MSGQREPVEQATGELFGDLWHRYDDALFKESVDLFEARWRANGEPSDHFQGKRCLDAGCGGGRYTFAMAAMGAAEAVGVDVGTAGLADARARAEAIGATNVHFERASVLELPFADESFDFACSSGVLHHTPGVEQGLRELRRVLKPGGWLYILVYGAGGLYWPLNLVTRAYADVLGYPEVDRCITAAELAANKRRTVLDDLFVPILETYSVERVDHLLATSGFSAWRRWGTGQADHESDPQTLIAELQIRERLWSAGAATATDASTAALERELSTLTSSVIEAAQSLVDRAARGDLDGPEVRRAVIGTGHHRVVAERGG